MFNVAGTVGKLFFHVLLRVGKWTQAFQKNVSWTYLLNQKPPKWKKLHRISVQDGLWKKKKTLQYKFV